MKKTIQLKNRAKAAIVLLAIMCLVLLGNLAGRQNYSNLDRSISSIYKDRLMPATYIYEISDHLYQKRLLQEESNPKSMAGERSIHDKAIASLIHDYEQTFLTPEEKNQWDEFKQQLAAYNALALNSSMASRQHFNEAMNRLHSLSRLQVGEGTELQKNAKAIISGSNIMSTFELSVLVILGFSAIILISKPEKLGPSKNYSLN
jgi:hypothetical protein